MILLTKTSIVFWVNAWDAVRYHVARIVGLEATAGEFSMRVIKVANFRQESQFSISFSHECVIPVVMFVVVSWNNRSVNISPE